MGAAPILMSQPDYARHLDADGDCIVCELSLLQWIASRFRWITRSTSS